MATSMLTPELMTSDEVAAVIGKCRNTVVRVCEQNPGFGFRFGRAWRIPRSHVDRVLRGEMPAQIAAEVRAGGASRAA